METFVYNGTTYVPLRAVSQYLGKDVKWDGKALRADINEPANKEGDIEALIEWAGEDKTVTLYAVWE